MNLSYLTVILNSIAQDVADAIKTPTKCQPFDSTALPKLLCLLQNFETK